MKLFFLILIALLPLGALAENPATLEARFDEANKLYAQSKFIEAATAYEQIIAEGKVAAVLYFNLGNAYFKAGQLGRAIAAYRQAEELAPRDPDVRANVQFARSRVTGPRINLPMWRQKLGTLSAHEWAMLSTAAVWVTFGLLIVRAAKPSLRGPLRSWTVGTVISSLLLIVLAKVAIAQSSSPQTAIVISSDVAVRNSPFDESPAAFTAQDGAELRVIDHKNDWLQVTDEANRFGWVKRSSVAWTPRHS